MLIQKAFNKISTAIHSQTNFVRFGILLLMNFNKSPRKKRFCKIYATNLSNHKYRLEIIIQEWLNNTSEVFTTPIAQKTNCCERNIGQIKYQTDCEERIRSQFIMKSSQQFNPKQTNYSFSHVSFGKTKKDHATEYNRIFFNIYAFNLLTH